MLGIKGLAGMDLTVMDYNGSGFCNYKFSSYMSTNITTHKIFEKSNTRIPVVCTATPNCSEKVQCAITSSQLVESGEEMNGKWRSLEGMVSGSANYVPLSPISFLERAAEVYRERKSIIYGSITYTWQETHNRCVKLASTLNHIGVSRGDVVATLAPNVPAMLELQFAVPMAGAIICNLNTRLDPNMLSTLLKHSEAKILFVDYQLLQVTEEAIDILKKTQSKHPVVVIISDPGSLCEYESLVDSGETEFSIIRPNNECDPISLNYTSGTTSRPKGVVFSHRGAYLSAISSVFMRGMGEMPTYLWSLPIFHCNGWCFSWGMAIVGVTNVCIRRCDPKEIFDNILHHNVTHMDGVPTVLNMIANSLSTYQKQLPHKVDILTGGAPPPPTIILKMEELGFHVRHVYGLTETGGPSTKNLWKPEWDRLPREEQMEIKARQGVPSFVTEEVDVKDPVTMESVKCDRKSLGEVMFRGNTIMSGYFKDLKATEEAFAGGWFRSGDLAVKHPDGYIEVKDRCKDIIISGGENICTIEVETVIYSHPGVLEVAVVARPDDHWGQTPCAFVKLKDGVDVDGQEIIEYCRDRMPHYMAPRTVVFDDLPRNSTGKVQKFVLREKANLMGSLCYQKV
ncbi:putative AMP-dependent synthetase/ligase, AMP-binding enzyme domain-containing protein [Helianthus annuus]|uniref:AMP-dependent synthetase/ligase, AMP-binding enzyme domain-containing protein n=1 Tax=Helianthus annuus TaxID=4232 RepID=A0A251TSV6_HELAN|nr:probable acyl-activating enzyme 1, peroxisomal [Helianthus annuus]KAF5797563.1 putative AMP-dependent synthetase/ligase, AMP-binding enzyme domain-containing protein [Helianthus annuus]KAJ0730422.1 putative AMP-dependent synthetase/ligase, AMP-binding, AMP-binding enzyme domain, ANL [Helianthus annuus]